MITINGEIHSSKNHRQIWRRKNGKPFSVKSDVSKADELMMYYQLLDQKIEWLKMTEGLSFPYHVTFVFMRKTRGHWDFINIVQGVADAMVKAGYIPDDDVEHFIPTFGQWFHDKEHPGVKFWVKRQ